MLEVGDKVGERELTTIAGAAVRVPSPDAPVHLQFRRFAGCPICNLHMRDVARRHQEIADAGVVEVVVFHSAAEELRRYQADLPFAVVADPDRKLYSEFGVESSIRSILHPRAWRAAARGFRWRGLGGALAPRETTWASRRNFSSAPTEPCLHASTASTPTISGPSTRSWRSQRVRTVRTRGSGAHLGI